ncbi:MAG: hypothetical protein ACTHK6_07605 [Solirubrobacterales bacterium]
MKNLNSFVLTFAAAAVLMALAGVSSASAATTTCGSGTLCPAEQAISSESEGKVVLDAPFGNVECESNLKGHITNSAGSADGPITTLSWSNCGGDTVTTLATGSLTIESGGTVKSTGARVTVIHLGVHCIYETSNTTIGTLTGSSTTGGNATLDISATIPRVGGTGGSFCGASAPWTGSYKVTSPSSLDVDSETIAETLDFSQAAPTFSAGQELSLTATNTGNVAWKWKAEQFAEATGSWDFNPLETCAPSPRNPGQSCTRKLKCTAAPGTIKWELEVETLAGAILRRSLLVRCD